MFRSNFTWKRVVIGVGVAFALTIPVVSANAQIVQGGIGNEQAAQQQQQGQGQGQEQNQANFGVNAQGQSNNQTIQSSAVPNLIQLPGFTPAYPNFTQPYKPDVFINGAGPVRPISMTYAQAKACNGQATSDDKRSIKLYYPQWDKVAPAATFSGYVGSARVEEKDGQWIEAVCAAAVEVMGKGATEGVVEYVIRPVNRTWGLGGSASFGGSGMPAAGANPYALAGAVGLGLGVSGSYVKGELMLNITGFTSGAVKSARLEEPEGRPSLKPVSFVPPMTMQGGD